MRPTNNKYFWCTFLAPRVFIVLLFGKMTKKTMRDESRVNVDENQG